MRNDKIGDMLKRYRKQNSMKVSDVVAILEDKYQIQVAEKTVYGWESNQAHPTADTFVSLCDLYKIHNLKDAIENSPPVKGKGFPITAEERALIKSYREQPELQAVVRRVLNMKDSI